MGLKFLTDEWFNKVKELRNDAGDIGITQEMKEVILNICVNHEDAEKQFHVKEGDAHLGHTDDAQTKITVDYDVAKKLFLEGDPSAGVQAFMAGQIKIEGDMSKLMMLQASMTTDPTPDQENLKTKILEVTEV